MAAIDLCTIAQVRQHGQYNDSETEQDPVISSLITRVSRSIMRALRREFAPASTSEARTIQFKPDDGRLIVLAPWDVRTVTAVTLEGTALASTDWMLAYHDRANSVYGGIELSSALTIPSSNFDRRTLAITGTWGFASIPEDVTEAAVQAVRFYLKNEVQGFGSIIQPNSLGGDANDPVALPPGIRGLLLPYDRGL